MKTSEFKKKGPEGPSEIFPHPLSTISFPISGGTTQEVSYV